MLVPNQMISDFVGLSWSRLEATPLVYACDAVLDVRECIGDACDGWMVRELRVISIDVVVNVMSFDHCRKVLSVSTNLSGQN